MNKTLPFIFAVMMLVGCDDRNSLNMPIEPLKNFASSYEPCSSQGECFSFFQLPTVPSDVAHVLDERIIDTSFIIYNTLIMLKLYRTQLEHAHQSYDIRNETSTNHPVLKAFRKYSHLSLSGDFVSSSITYEWVLKQKQLASVPIIAKEIKRIEQVHENIDRETYWQ